MSTVDAADQESPAVRPDAVEGEIEVELAQSLGLAETLWIGIGTMIGARIFVLPGFITGKAGPDAVLAFATAFYIAGPASMSTPASAACRRAGSGHTEGGVREQGRAHRGPRVELGADRSRGLEAARCHVTRKNVPRRIMPRRIMPRKNKVAGVLRAQHRPLMRR